jgi:hypothetical protein
MPISLVHVVEIQHQHITAFEIKQLTTALIANQIRAVTKPISNSFYELYNGFGSLIGRTDRAAQEKAVAFGIKENIIVDATRHGYSIPSFDITVTLSGKVEVFLKFLNLDDAEQAYVELLTASSLSQVAQEKTSSGEIDD